MKRNERHSATGEIMSQRDSMWFFCVVIGHKETVIQNQHFIQQIHFVIQYTCHTQSPTCFGTDVPSSGCYYNKVVPTNLPTYVLFVLVSLLKSAILLKYIVLLKHIKLIVMTVYSILLFYNTLIISRLSCQFLIAFICIGGVSKHRFWFHVILHDLVQTCPAMCFTGRCM